MGDDALIFYNKRYPNNRNGGSRSRMADSTLPKNLRQTRRFINTI
jgi:hypothetical protein